jgi:N-acyl-D-aspartate/D-glutamate deacylase
VVAASGADMPALLESPEWRAAAREEWDRTKLAMFPVNRLDVVRIVEVVGPENERWLGRTVADVVAERGGHPSDVLADFVLGNDCRPGLVATGMANSDVEGVAQTLKNPAVLISSSDSGAHAQMMCSSGDTTLLLTRHVRERGDFTLEDAIYQLTGRQADVFGFQRRGVLAPGNVADLNVFALDELTYGGDEFVKDLPQGGVRMRRPTGGYRSTLLGGTIVQQAGERTGALPGRVISSIG